MHTLTIELDYKRGMLLSTISLCMIVKNESSILGRCLSSISPAVDEIIIVDTGSTDHTKEIAKAYNATIYDFPWNDNFSDARNFSFSKASMDYCMWMDADDIITEENLEKLLSLKASLSPRTDIVMFQYAAGFSKDGTPTFLYYRERLIRNHAGFLWQGPVHECITPSENIVYSDIIIEHHRPDKRSHSKRNLEIYEKSLKQGTILSPRDKLYYARELMASERLEDAKTYFIEVIYDKNAWIENQIEACRNLSACFLSLGQEDDALEALFKSFTFDCPRAETLCDLGDIFKRQKRYTEAIYWYKLALKCEENIENGGFTDRDRHGYYPCVQLCSCYFLSGNPQESYRYHKMSGQWHTDTPEYQYNETFFRSHFPQMFKAAQHM